MKLSTARTTHPIRKIWADGGRKEIYQRKQKETFCNLREMFWNHELTLLDDSFPSLRVQESINPIHHEQTS